MSFTLTRNRLVVLSLCFFLAAAAEALAQDVRIETQRQARSRNENAIEDQAAPEDTSDPELGEIKLVSRAPRPKMFTFSTSQTLNYSSNAFLVRDNEQSDYFWNGGVGASFVPYATRDFTPRLTFNQDWFRYDDFSDLDFDAQTLQLDLKYNLNHDDTWYVNGSYALARLSSPDTGEFYRYGLLGGSITHVVQLRTAPVTIGVTGGTYWRHGDPSPSDRVGAYLSVAAIYSICETVQLSGFSRPEMQHYTHEPSRSSRDDFNLTLGATLSWQANQYVALAATASYVGNFSTISDHRYDLFAPSLVFGARFEF
jgi:hypothetical protein